MRTIRTVLPLILVVLLAGCAAAAAPSPSPTPASSPVSSPEEAEARVEALHPQFAGLEPLDPDVIGACCWSEATAVEGGYQVVFTVGWGDCPAGCIERHTWTFAVSPAGEVALIGEQAPAAPPNVIPNAEG